MKICPQCNSQIDDNAGFCNVCGFNFTAFTQGQPNPQNGQQSYAQNNDYQQNAYDPFDHTAEFNGKDISDNKVIAMLVYLLGPVGIFIALLASSESPYVSFHVRQALKIIVLQTISVLAACVLFWTVIVPFAAGVFAIILFVVKIICFVQICKGQAKEPPVVKNFGFLK